MKIIWKLMYVLIFQGAIQSEHCLNYFIDWMVEYLARYVANL